MRFGQGDCVSTLAVEWIEICSLANIDITSVRSPPSRWSGLKSEYVEPEPLSSESPPSRWSGLKSDFLTQNAICMGSPPSRWSGLKYRYANSIANCLGVSTLAVEWIEISFGIASTLTCPVSTLAVEWIEIMILKLLEVGNGRSPPSRWSGLKSLPDVTRGDTICLHPRGGVD